jgi:hypothetical protein
MKIKEQLSRVAGFKKCELCNFSLKICNPPVRKNVVFY